MVNVMLLAKVLWNEQGCKFSHFLPLSFSVSPLGEILQLSGQWSSYPCQNCFLCRQWGPAYLCTWRVMKMQILLAAIWKGIVKSSDFQICWLHNEQIGEYVMKRKAKPIQAYYLWRQINANTLLLPSSLSLLTHECEPLKLESWAEVV